MRHPHRIVTTTLFVLALWTNAPCWGESPQDLTLRYADWNSPGESTGSSLDPELITRVGGSDWVAGYPGWYARAEGLFLHRSRPRRKLLTVVDVGNTTTDPSDDLPILDTDDLHFDDYEGGYRVALGRSLGNGLALEGSVFSIQDWTSTASVTANGDIVGRIDPANPPPDPLSPPEPINPLNPGPFDTSSFYQALQHEVTYRSDLVSAEMNLRATWRYRNLIRSELVGVRYLQVREYFQLRSQDDSTSTELSGIGTYDISTDNDLLGLQYGQEATLPVMGALFLTAVVKAGVFANAARQHSQIIDSRVTLVDAEAEDEDIAFVGEVGAMCNMKLTKNIQFRTGYNCLWVEGLALAPEHYTFVPGAQGELITHGGQFYHGFSVGFEIQR